MISKKSEIEFIFYFKLFIERNVLPISKKQWSTSKKPRRLFLCHRMYNLDFLNIEIHKIKFL